MLLAVHTAAYATMIYLFSRDPSNPSTGWGPIQQCVMILDFPAFFVIFLFQNQIGSVWYTNILCMLALGTIQWALIGWIIARVIITLAAKSRLRNGLTKR